MTIPLAPRISDTLPPITWEKLPADFVLPDEPVESTLQPLLAAALRESLELASLIVEASLIASIVISNKNETIGDTISTNNFIKGCPHRSIHSCPL